MGYYLLTKSAHSGSLLQDLNRKLHLYHPRHLANAYHLTMNDGRPYSYILIDTTIFSDPKSSVRMGLFPGELSYIYCPLEY